MSSRINGLKLSPQPVDLQEAHEFRGQIKSESSDLGRASLMQKITDRFPFMPPWPAYHPALSLFYHNAFEMSGPSVWRLTDEAYLDWALDRSRIKDTANRIEHRRQEEIRAAERHVEASLLKEDLWQAFYFKRAAETRWRETTRLSQAAEDALIQNQLVSRGLFSRALLARDLSRELIEEGFATRKRNWVWRRDVLYVTTGNDGLVKSDGRGARVEAQIAQLGWDQRQGVSADHREWRNDNLYAAVPSGGITRFAGGAPLEHVMAELQVPEHEARHSATQVWRENVTRITTPNGGLVPMAHQGSMPEAALAALDVPTQLTRAENHANWRHDYLMGPNFGIAVPELREKHAPRVAENFRELKRSLAAHEESVSLLRNHVFPSPIDANHIREEPTSDNTQPAANASQSPRSGRDPFKGS